MSVDTASNTTGTDSSSSACVPPATTPGLADDGETTFDLVPFYMTSTCFGPMPVRKGKWTPEEEAYLKCVVRCFNSGLLRLPTGRSLRSLLSERLHCDPMRITKKYSGQSCIGKQIFVPCERSEANSRLIAKNEKELFALEQLFIASLGGVEAIASLACEGTDRGNVGFASDAQDWGAVSGHQHQSSPPAPSNCTISQSPPRAYPLGDYSCGAAIKGSSSSTKKRPSSLSTDISTFHVKDEVAKRSKYLHLPAGNKTPSCGRLSDESSQRNRGQPCTELMKSDPGQVLMSNRGTIERPFHLPAHAASQGGAETNKAPATGTEDDDTSAGILLWGFFQNARTLVEKSTPASQSASTRAPESIGIKEEYASNAPQSLVAVKAERPVEAAPQERATHQPTMEEMYYAEHRKSHMFNGAGIPKFESSNYNPMVHHHPVPDMDPTKAYGGHPAAYPVFHHAYPQYNQVPMLSHNVHFLPAQPPQPFMQRVYWPQVAGYGMPPPQNRPNYAGARSEVDHRQHTRQHVVGDLCVDQ